MAERNPFGIALSNTLLDDVAQVKMPAPSPKKMGKGQIILGIIADALAGAAGRQGPFAAQMMRQKQQELEDVNWGRRRQADLEDYEKKQQIEQRYASPSPMERDVAAWERMGEPQRQAYQQMQGMRAGDPDVFVTLPNGQVYAGPKSGLAQALTGGAPPMRPQIGSIVPDPRRNGGQTPPASGGFPRPF